MKTGDVVDITIKGAHVRNTGVPWPQYVIDDVLMNLPTTLPSVTVDVVEPAPPANWPPRQKDLWRDGSGELWFGVDVSDPNVTSLPEIKLVPSYDEEAWEAEVVRKHWPEMTLVYRAEG
ncbi:hypothetical protein AB0K16_22120 [Nonomuraea jabiensis]|uniref:hypothetical protein n=1 Tax=Nonomuraea jabiensis TaxID=882448 RepID=UPI00342057F2